MQPDATNFEALTNGDSYCQLVPAKPPSGDPYWGNVVLLLHGDGADGGTTFTDSSSYAATALYEGGITTSAAQAKFGSASILPVTESVVRFPAAARYGTGGDYTIEFFTYRPADQIFTRAFSVYPAGPQIGFFNTSTQLEFACSSSVAFSVANFFSGLLNTWVHIAIVRASGITTLYRNGIAVASTSNSFSQYDFSSSTTVLVGAFGYGGTNRQSWNGYIDEFRYTVGIARYLANFTPPAAPFLNR